MVLAQVGEANDGTTIYLFIADWRMILGVQRKAAASRNSIPDPELNSAPDCQMVDVSQKSGSRRIVREPLANDVEQGRAGGGIHVLIYSALGFLKRQYLVLAICVVLGAAVSTAYLKITPATYTAEAKVLLEGAKIQFGQREWILVDATLDTAK